MRHDQAQKPEKIRAVEEAGLSVKKTIDGPCVGTSGSCEQFRPKDPAERCNPDCCTPERGIDRICRRPLLDRDRRIVNLLSQNFSRCVRLLATVCYFSLTVSVRAEAGSATLYRERPDIDPNRPALPGLVVVKMKPGAKASIQELLHLPDFTHKIVAEADPTSMESLIQMMGVKPDKASRILNGIYLVHYSGTVTPALMAESLMRNSDVLYAEPHYIYKLEKINSTPADSLISQQYGLNLIHAFEAWNITRGDSDVVVGIVDSGVNWMHPDLYPNIWHNPHWKTDTRFPGDSIGWDFGGTNGTPDNNPEEDFPPPHEHGTHVAGIVAAVGDGIGTSGVAPGCRIMPVKVTEKMDVDPKTGLPLILYGYEGIVYAADNGARIINCSWGEGYTQYGQDIVDYATAKGALVVAAAGNSHSDGLDAPAAFDQVLSVAATNQSDIATTFTNYNYNVSVSAPGLDILSTWGTDSYAERSGTSMASPFAAGVAALVASAHPNYLPEQLLEQVRVSSDNIDGLNPSYRNMLGFGRVDAYRALTVKSPGVQVTDIFLGDSAHGSDGDLATAEGVVDVSAEVIDWLAPISGLQLSLTSNDPYVTIENGKVSVGSLGTLDSINIRANPLTFRVHNGTPDGHVATFFISMVAGSYHDYTSFRVILDPIYNEVNVNNIATTISSKGNIGFTDYPDNTEGVGFIYRPDNDSLLFEGAFMAGTSPAKVVDCARGVNPDVEDHDFTPVGPVTLKTPGPVAPQELTTEFTDSNASANRIGINVSVHAYEFDSDSSSDFVLLSYKIKNYNYVPIDSLYAGLFLDWTIGPGGLDNMAEFAGRYDLGYVYNATGKPGTYAGCALIYGAPVNYTAINNRDSLRGIDNGFSKLHKWESLSGGVKSSEAGPGDVSMVVSGGPLYVSANSDTVLAFVLSAGDSLHDLTRATAVASRIYYRMRGNVDLPPYLLPDVPTMAYLYQNYPNPFNPTTTIPFALKKPARVSLEVFDVLGQRVLTLINGKSYNPGGPYHVELSDAGLASGVYFVRLIAITTTHTYVEDRKIAIVK